MNLSISLQGSTAIAEGGYYTIEKAFIQLESKGVTIQDCLVLRGKMLE